MEQRSDSAEPTNSNESSYEDEEDDHPSPDSFVHLESAESMATAEMDRMLDAAGVRAEEVIPEVSRAARQAAEVDGGQGETVTERELALIRLVELRAKFHDWAHTREVTIAKLRSIADYVDSVSRKTGVAKIVGSSGGALAGGLTIVGGALTLATAGAALPVLLAGTGLGLASGVTGGAAAITEKIIKSKQMKEAEEAIAHDKETTEDLEHLVVELRESAFARQIAKEALLSGGGAVNDSLTIFGLVTTGVVGGGTLGKIGVEALAKIFGEDVGKELSKVILHTSGRVLTGSVTVVLGGATLAYDIYKLNNEVQAIAKLGTEGASELRNIADKLEESLIDLKMKGEEKNHNKGESDEDIEERRCDGLKLKDKDEKREKL